jgi:hypothetical protein
MLGKKTKTKKETKQEIKVIIEYGKFYVYF